jgi:hypothetical protein
MERKKHTLKLSTTLILALIFNCLYLFVSPTLAKPCSKACQSTVKLCPHVRAEPFGQPAPIPYETIKPFLRDSIIVPHGPYHDAPYVVAIDNDRTEASLCSTLYVRKLPCHVGKTFSVYRWGKTYSHPCTREILGFEADLKGRAELITHCEPAVLKVIESKDGIEVGDRVLPDSGPLQPKLIPRPARASEFGYILAVKEGDAQIGRNNVVIVSLGTREGLHEGDVLDIYKAGKDILDPVHHAPVRCIVRLPNTRVGCLLIFKTYEKLSLGLVLEATEVISLLDKVKNP